MLRKVDFLGLFANLQGNQNEVKKNIKSLEQHYDALDKKINNKFEAMKTEKASRMRKIPHKSMIKRMSKMS